MRDVPDPWWKTDPDGFAAETARVVYRDCYWDSRYTDSRYDYEADYWDDSEKTCSAGWSDNDDYEEEKE